MVSSTLGFTEITCACALKIKTRHRRQRLLFLNVTVILKYSFLSLWLFIKEIEL